MAIRKPTFKDLTEVLREQRDLIHERLNVRQSNMFIPTDGQGLRIRICVPQDTPDELPEKIDLCLADGTDIEVPLEITKDYQPIEIQK